MAVVSQDAASLAAGKVGARSLLSTTPGILQASLALVVALALACWVAAHACIGEARTAVQTVGKDAVPSIIAAQQVRSNLADMNANAANAFFSHGTREARAQYETDRQTAADRMVTAAQNITYGNEERVPILSMVSGVQSYIGQVEAARTLGYPNGLDTLRTASAQMHEKLLPAAESLDKANFAHLDTAYNDSKLAIPAAMLGVWVVGIIMFAALIAIQVFLLVRMKRVLNLPLAAATIILLLWLFATSSTVASIRHDLKVAKEDSFDSLDALWRARAIAYDANGDESLYLLESGSRGNSEAEAVHESEAAFRAKAAQIADSPLSNDVLAQIQPGKVRFKGLLADELNNITFDGEADAAMAALHTYAVYMQMDAHIRDLETSSRHQEAVEFCTGTQVGQSNWGFAQFDNALQKVIDINKQAFDNSVEHGFRGLAWLPVGAVIAPLLVVGLAWIGLLPRLREYAHT